MKTRLMFVDFTRKYLKDTSPEKEILISLKYLANT